MTITEYLLSRIDWRIAKDEWVKAIMQAGAAGVDDMAQRIEAIANSEDFERMDVSRIAYYEALLGIQKTDGSIEQRRKAVQAFWSGGGHPSFSSVAQLAEFWSVSNVAVDYLPSEKMVIVMIPEGTPISPYVSYMLRETIRRHIPAHLALTIDDSLATSYLTVADMDGKKISEANETKLYNFVG